METTYTYSITKPKSNYEDLIVWRKSMKFVTKIYKSLKKFPSEERFGLVSQMKKCAVSIPSNIAEGQGRRSYKSFKYFLDVSHGSLTELHTQILISQDLGFINDKESKTLIFDLKEIGKMIFGLKKSILPNK